VWTRLCFLPAPFSAGALGHPGARPRRLPVFALVVHSCVAALIAHNLKQALCVEVTLDELAGGAQSICSSTRASTSRDKDNRLFPLVLSGVGDTLCRRVLGGSLSARNGYEGSRRRLFSISCSRCPLLYLAEPVRRGFGDGSDRSSSRRSYSALLGS
jgi:hypothetical protein